MRSPILLLLVASCTLTRFPTRFTVEPERLSGLRRSGRVAFVVAPREWNRADLKLYRPSLFNLITVPNAVACVACSPAVSSDAFVIFEYSDAARFIEPIDTRVRQLALARGGHAVAEALGVPVVSSGDPLLDELATAATWSYPTLVGGGPSLDTPSASDRELFPALNRAGFSTLVVLSTRSVYLKRSRNSVGAELELNVFDTATGELLHQNGTPWGNGLERDLDPALMSTFFPDVSDAGKLWSAELARVHHQRYRPLPEAVAAVEQALGAIVEDFVTQQLGPVASPSPQWYSKR
jgi:hypothetical protein